MHPWTSLIFVKAACLRNGTPFQVTMKKTTTNKQILKLEMIREVIQSLEIEERWI